MNKNTTLNLSLTILFLLFFSFQSYAQNQKSLDVALQYLEQQREGLQLTQQDISNYKVNDHYTSKHNGVTHIYLQQQYEQIDVQNALININILPSEEILNMGNRFVSDLANKINTTTPSIEPIDALQKVVTKFGETDGSSIQLKERKNAQHYIYENEGIALEPIPVRLVYELQEDGLVRLIWQVRFYTLDAQHMWNTQVDAVTGEILDFYDEVLHCDFSHAHDFCKNEKHKFHKEEFIGVPYRNNLSPIMANAYNVFPIPIESPSHGNRALVTNPSDTTASPYGWHDTDGMAGEEFTITRGNNVHAYHDVFSQNLSVGGEPDGGTMLEFDYPFSTMNDTVYQQMDAAMTNLFYWNNITHDLWYHYGFDEVSGNFQANNYGNGGTENDHVRAEALDGGGTNNANFFTPDDGSLPRMQMFIWGVQDFPESQNNIVVTDTANMDTIIYDMRPAGFGAPMPTMSLVGDLVLVDDGEDNIFDACTNVGNPLEVIGKIALLDRGENGCQFGTQALKAQNAGAIAVIICNNDEDNENRIFTMIPGDDGNDVTVPTVMVSKKTCDTLKAYLPDLSISLKAPDFVFENPGPTGLDSDFDNGVIIHEYTHGISNRLTGGPSESSCLRNMEQAGEGWSDWFALVMTTTSADNANEGRGIGTYLRGEGPNGDGIREYRYSRNMDLNPHIYSDVDDVSVPHGVGSIWAVTIWDLYWNMVDLYGFDDDLYHGTGGNNMTMQLVLDGLKLQPCSPTFIDSRDAILAADMANHDGAHQCLIWETFARRGIGFSAVAGGTDRYDLPVECQTRLKINKLAADEIPGGDVLTYTLEVINDEPQTLNNIVITDFLPEGVELIESSISCTDYSLVDRELTIQLGDMMTGDTLICTYNVMVAASPVTYLSFEDDMENGINDWVISAGAGIQLWTLNEKSYEGDFSWFAENTEEAVDLRLTSAQSYLINDANARLTFWHSYNTEANRDGGNVEISIDGGATWIDQRQNFLRNGYNGILLNEFLDGDQGFTSDRSSYQLSEIELSDYQGEEILFRFRFSSNSSGAVDGWYIDNVKLYGDYHTITNTACVTSDLNEEYCTNVVTVVTGNPTTAIEILKPELGISIFPNPTAGKVFVKIENNNLPTGQAGNTFAILKLIGLDGRVLKIKNADASNGIIDFDLGAFPKGIYLLQIQTDETQVVEKVVLQK